MTPLRFSEAPARHAEASRLTWRIAQAIVARKRGWSLDQLVVSRSWNLRVGKTRWSVRVYVSFFFEGLSGRGPAAIYGINVETKGTVDEEARAALVRELATKLGDSWTRDGERLFRRIRETRPALLLAEMDRVANAFGSSDTHRVPRSRARKPEKRLVAIAETVLAHETWFIETLSVRLFPSISLCASLSLSSSGGTGERPSLGALLFVLHDDVPDAASIRARAESRGYVERAGEGQPEFALQKSLPLSLRAALAEARFLEAQVLDAR